MYDSDITVLHFYSNEPVEMCIIMTFSAHIIIIDRPTDRKQRIASQARRHSICCILEGCPYLALKVKLTSLPRNQIMNITNNLVLLDQWITCKFVKQRM